MVPRYQLIGSLLRRRVPSLSCNVEAAIARQTLDDDYLAESGLVAVISATLQHWLAKQHNFS
jgi:hypothetical protein